MDSSKSNIADSNGNKLNLGVVGLTHTHVHWLFESERRGEFEVVGITEPNRELAQSYAEQYGFDMALVFDDMNSMLEHGSPEAIAAFGSIYEHLEVVECAAPLGIHVMVEKPLAVNMEHANKMHELAVKHDIHLLTNYETTWYPTNHKADSVLSQGCIGQLRKAVICDGHQGPAKLGVNKEFLDWLIDPEQNGGGAITDFGCYGANLMTWLTKGERPVSVTAMTQHFQPEDYPDVDDESLIILKYKNANAVIMGSWNWPFPRKDMELFGTQGKLVAHDKERIDIDYLDADGVHKNEALSLSDQPAPFDDPFSYFKAVIRGEVECQSHDLSALENNMLVVELLDAARESAKTGRTVTL